MPQMAPMNWMSLYFFFIMIFILMVIMNYFMIMYKNNPHKIMKKMKKFNWKW